MEKNYYFLASLLPDLQIGYPPEINLQDFMFLLETNLTPEDLAKTKALRRYYDIQNVRAFWLKKKLDPRGNLDINELEDALASDSDLPEYFFDFLKKHQSFKDRIHFFSELLEAYFRFELERSSGFIRKYLQFERDLRLILVGFRTKELNRDLIKELQFEDPQDDIVAQMIAQKDAKVLEPPAEYEDLKTLIEQTKDDPLVRHQALSSYRFQKLAEMVGVNIFSIDRILAYMLQLILVEKWMELDKQKGQQIIGEL